MKRNILLAFLLIGLVVMEWGCYGGCGQEFNYDLQPAKGSVWTIEKPKLRQGDSSVYDKLVFDVSFPTKLLAVHRINSTMTNLYACEESIDVITNPIDSVAVRVDNDYISDTTLLPTLFVMRGDERMNVSDIGSDMNIYVPSYFLYQFYLNSPPIRDDFYRFTFEFYSNGEYHSSVFYPRIFISSK